MSYRNPQIIVDRSSEIYAQGFANLGQQAAGMIEKENERQRKIIEQQDKEDKAYKLMLNDKSLEAYKNADDIYAKIEGSSLFDQFKETYKGLIEGDGENEGAIKAETILALRGSDLSTDERKRLYKQVSDADAYEKTMIQFAGFVQNDLTEYEENGTAGNIGNKFAWVGKDNKEKFGNMLAVFSLANEEVPWAKSTKDLKRKDGVNTVFINTRINTRNDKAAKYIKDLKLEGKLGDIDEDGYANITWERDVTKYGKKGLMVEIPSAIDKVETLETVGLLKGGQPVPGLIQQKSNIVTSFLNGKEVTTTRQYLDESKFGKKNKNLTDAIESHAAGIVNGKTSLSEQQAYMQRLKGYEFNLEDWSKMDPDAKIDAITKNVLDNIKGELGLGSFVPRQADAADVKFYKEQLGKDIEKGKEIYVKTNEKFSDIKTPNDKLAKYEIDTQKALDDFKYISKKLNDKDFKWSTKNLTDLAGSFGVNYEADVVEEDGETIKGSILNYGGKKITISKNDSRENTFKKILQLRVPGLKQVDYDKAIKKLKTGDNINMLKGGPVNTTQIDWLGPYPDYWTSLVAGEKTSKQSDNKEPTGSKNNPLIYNPQ